MALALQGVEDTGPEFRSIYDVVAVHISKLIATYASDSSRSVTAGPEAADQSSNRPPDSASTKVKIDFSNVSAFVVPAHGKNSYDSPRKQKVHITTLHVTNNPLLDTF